MQASAAELEARFGELLACFEAASGWTRSGPLVVTSVDMGRG